jgi:uncharacterized membrane protein HdeD (DUF308 family)
MDALASYVSKNWWVLILRGILSILFGIAVLVQPGASLLALVYVFGVYAIFDGILSLVLAFRGEGSAAWLVVRGFLGIVAGVLAFRYPGITLTSLYVLIGAWAIGIGIVELVVAVMHRGRAHAVGIGVVTALLSIAVGIGLLVLPQAGIVALLGLIAAYAIVHGLLMIGAGIDVHHMAPRHAT